MYLLYIMDACLEKNGKAGTLTLSALMYDDALKATFFRNPS